MEVVGYILGIAKDNEVNRVIVLIELLLDFGVVNGLREEYPVEACKCGRGL